MPFISPRPVSKEEVELLSAVLTHAQIQQRHHINLESLKSLLVHSKCDCGCASIGFLPEDEATPDNTRLLADGQGFSAEGEEVGVLVYGTEDRVVDMEVYWYKTSGAPLPLAASIGESPAQPLSNTNLQL